MIETIAENNRIADATDVIDATTEGRAHNVTNTKLNIPFNLNNWKKLDEAVVKELMWFHQYCLDEGFSQDEAAEALNVSTSTIYKVLKGIYEASYAGFAAEVAKYRKMLEKRRDIQNSEFVETRNTKLIWDALDLALQSNTITMVSGESGMSKSMTLKEWQAENNHGQTILVEAPELGGVNALMREICERIGRTKSQSAIQMRDSIRAAFNRNRMLIVDEAHRLLPGNSSRNPTALEFLRSLHDKTKCGLALVATHRFGKDLEASKYQYEQLLGRINMPCRLFPQLEEADLKPLLAQYFSPVTKYTMETSLAIANGQLPEYKGRLRVLVELLRLTSRMASQKKTRATEEHFRKCMAVRTAMMGYSH